MKQTEFILRHIAMNDVPDVLQKVALLPDVGGRRARRPFLGTAAAAAVSVAPSSIVVGVKVAIVDVDDVRNGEDADEAGPQIGALAPQILRLLLHEHRVADVNLDLVLQRKQRVHCFSVRMIRPAGRRLLAYRVGPRDLTPERERN